MDILKQTLEALQAAIPDEKLCEDCGGTGMTLVTRGIADPVSGGFLEESEELCETCCGEGI